MSIENNEKNQLDPARKAWVENISLLLAHKKMILITSFIVTAFMAVYLFAFAKTWYLSSANVMPARKAGGGGLLDGISSGISSTLKDIGVTQIAGKGKSDGTYSPLAIISSRNLQEQIIKEFDLVKVYEAENMEDAVKEFSQHASADVLEEGNIGVSFEDTDPKRAATIANRLVRGMNETNSRLAIEEAKFNRTYIEMRYAKLLADLDSTEKALGAFQKKYGVYELKTQATAQLTVLGALEQQRYMSEVQAQNAAQLYGEDAAETRIMRSQVADLSNKLEGMKTGLDKNASSYMVPMDVMPDVALQYIRLTRDFEIQSKLKALLLPSYEQAKLDESKQSLAYVVMDSAIPPEKKARPKRSIMLLSAFLGTLALTSIFVVAISNWKLSKARFNADKQALGIN
jgi:capsule polysaccharide export protein KpsE/RkpR